jgi:predicted permease
MWGWVRSWFDRDEGSRAELDEEMAFHLDRLADDLVREGMSPNEARREAVRRFGNPERVQERAREERGLAFGDELRRNVRFALRGLVRDPVHSSTFVLTTALTVVLGGLAWAAGDATLWRSLPYPESDRLVQISMVDMESATVPTSTAVDGATWFQLESEGPEYPRAVFSGWASGVNLSAAGAAAFVQQQRVGAGYFDVLGVRPERGREFLASEDVVEGPALAILSHALWRNTFGGDPEILGGTIRLKGEPHTVVGIMPEDFRSSAGADVWTPLRPSVRGEGGGTNYSILARLPDGVPLVEARSRLAAVAAAPDWAARDGDWRFGAIEFEEVLKRGARTPVRVLLGGIGLMLLIGWANLAGLQIARTLARTPELATRRALGGDAGTLVRQMAVESATIGLLGGLVGIAALVVATPSVEALVQSRFGTWQPFPSAGVLAGAGLVLTLAAILVAAAAPMIRASRPGLARAVVSGTRVRGRRRRGLRQALLVAQLALVTVLVFSAGLLARSYGHLDGLERGFDASDVLTVQYSLDDARFAEAEAVRDLFDRSLDALGRRPEVASAAVALTLPYERPLNLVVRHLGEEANLLANVVYVTEDFFETLRMPVRRGRTFDSRDGAEDPTVMVANQAFVDRYLEDRDPLSTAMQMSADLGEVPIVGVVGNVQQSAGWGDAPTPVWETPTLYLSARQMSSGFFQGMHVWFAPSWIVRAADSGRDLPGPVAETLRSVAPDLPVARTATLRDIVGGAFARQRLEAGFLMVIAAFALVLAGIGLYGLVSQEVVERRGEMGVRMALGASPRGAIIRTGAGGVRLTAFGLAIGIALAAQAAGLLENLVFGVGTWDPWTLAGLVATLAVLAVVASFVPAVRIGRLDPARVLRGD